MSFVDRRILVTGAASGIGLATAVAFARGGAKVIFADRVAPPSSAVAEGSYVLEVDLADPLQAADMVTRAVQLLGGLDGLVNSAGIACGTRIDQLTDAEWARVMAINLTAPFVVCRSALPSLRQSRDATIVNVASATALLPSALAGSAYAASKGGVLVFTKALAAEVAPSVRVNAVCPGLVDTPLMAHALHGEKGPVPGMLDAYSMRRAATPSEIANAILFLSSNQSSFINGVSFPVDGGRTFH